MHAFSESQLLSSSTPNYNQAFHRALKKDVLLVSDLHIVTWWLECDRYQGS
jgi:hypothetical protein